ncbi:MAG TPA: T9SS type A sorting domain-containing protein, partial [Chitinophagales bacterium]|nr:T9SS type A sorting domain-containing protein [Chitinophagales bacterium]
YNIYPTNNAVEIQAGLLDANGVILSSVTGSGNLSKTYTPTASGWLSIKMRNKLATTPGQNVYVKVTYTSPQTPSAITNPGSAKTETDTTPLVWLSNEESQINIYPNPAKGDWINLSITANEESIQAVEIVDVSGRLVHHQALRLWEGDNEYTLTPAQKLPIGVYMLRLSGMEIPKKLVIVE